MNKGLTRIFVYMTCISLVVAFMVSPVTAADTDDGGNMVNYFDYNYAPTAYSLTATANTVSLPLHDRFYIRYVDFLIGTGQGLTSVSAQMGAGTADLEVVYVGNGVYRVYGNMMIGRDNQISLTFGLNTFPATVQIWSFNYCVSNFQYWSDIGTIEAGTSLDPSTVKTATMKDKSTPAVIVFDSEPVPRNYFVDVYSANWRKYDYIDFFIGLESAGVNSIAVDFGSGLGVPFSISYLDSSGNLSFEIVEDTMQEFYAGNAYYTFPNGLSSDWIQIRLDVRNLDKSYSGNPVIRLTGPLGPYEDDYSISLISVAGSIKIDNQSPLSVWFNNIKEFFTDLFNPNDGESSETGKQMEEAADELNKGGEAFDKVDTPDIDASNLTGQFTNFSASGLTVLSVITSNPYVTSLLVLVFTFALCAYIFFGKRR